MQNDDEILNAAAERAELRQLVKNDEPMQPWEVQKQVFNRIFGAFEPRVPTNPETYKAKGQDL